jgi:hypothetical protein
VFRVDELNAVIGKWQPLPKIQSEISLRVHVDIDPIPEDFASAA